MTEEKKSPTLRFEEGMRQFMSIRKGVSYFTELAVDMLLGEEHIGHIRASGRITISGTKIEDDSSRIMSYSNTFTLEQWKEISAKAEEFVKKCAEREVRFGPAFGRLEALARQTFSEDTPFGHAEIVRNGHDHLAIAGGKGQWETYSPGIYTYNSAHYKGEEVKVGYRPVTEQRVRGVNNLEDEMLLQLLKLADFGEAEQPSNSHAKEPQPQAVGDCAIFADRGEM
ncbi:MAG: hypothetical protein UY31_C0023G0006 [Candidatus Wolfebacteria bacterium GW2011_GWE1_48_7]|uniref:Uncharacterized protein n=2 Tax=Candidatus Wolfeibacteriota TaxID=1752735 RepID=A0A0G1U960_9BACT|nr:MAG: hypothetical protein UX70_C0001G0865 [Candidatus Wolfebacteria bacterium GW2011_GWB1_47_1]KKU42150.1 MAG: hypothetical protein UX58_C0003G0074 [Candidatus Wolfebacteria bacterium GW2011_GWB2_46_69]KKU54074.1 MAG: hypothetical protein UX76_C0006G0040 [Candidatus Wolfebacteria bacterium GW2011_GWC1_47_103]KKU59261.1 MAG: hypothetical protein UX83_C0006G0031 [Candidatus Wolfebacteria bacterium GW2011_GWE2_47_12]KKU66013.1 MAG: hypothetical protein UX90_C0001G0072 [Candidatus Wolfebacteria 